MVGIEGTPTRKLEGNRLAAPLQLTLGLGLELRSVTYNVRHALEPERCGRVAFEVEVLAQLPVLQPIPRVERGHVDGKTRGRRFDRIRIRIDVARDLVPHGRRVMDAGTRLDGELASGPVPHGVRLPDTAAAAS